MNLEMAINIGQNTLYTVLILSGPVLLTALLVGSIVSLLQAVTQIQEITLVFVPKIIAVFLVLALAGGWMLNTAVSFGVEMFASIEQME
ncbi:MAG: flagellar biosynthesis protein FliQ [Myxococcota bacterium]|jgi:flagellar biosynthetic protein FliQ|nr:flagellar biosynthesis protein FliQ [Myxococcota bacterium]